MKRMRYLFLVLHVNLTLGLLCSVAQGRQVAATAPSVAPAQDGDDIPQHFRSARSLYDYDRREQMIPMRDGVHLHLVLLVPHAVAHAPIMLVRTPYGASRSIGSAGTTRYDDLDRPPSLFNDLLMHGYMLAIEDVRGKYGSKGSYTMYRPAIGPLNHTATDESTDTYDTIDWLVRHVPEGNGRIGTVGTSYDGFTVLMGLMHPHPALKAAVPICPAVDTWVGDDRFHHGAFRQIGMSYVFGQTTTRDSHLDLPSIGADDWPIYMQYVSAGAYGAAIGLNQLPFWNRLTAHPAYDAFWQDQAVDRLLGQTQLSVPTLYVDSMWDQEDIYGAIAVWEATRKSDVDGRDMLAIGPWYHGQVNGSGASIGPLDFPNDTARWLRRHVLLPFLDAHLKDGTPATHFPHVIAYQPGTDTWRGYAQWPQACTGCATASRMLYLQAGGHLSFDKPAAGQAASDAFVSDPAKPVPYRPRPIRMQEGVDPTWRTWLLDDQRFADGRPDVLTYTSDVLTAPVTLTGAPVAHLFASTSGTDADWVIKLIDLYPNDVPDEPRLGSYELPVAMDIMRARYRDDPARPISIPSSRTVSYALKLPNVDYQFQPGHRIMVQIQSSWFPLYDRNPQRFVPNIFFAQPKDYQAASEQVFHAPGAESAIELPIVPGDVGTVFAPP